jgi:pimeloyl-ACP methyl ester carboxylesterase
MAVVSYDRAGFSESALPHAAYGAVEEVHGLQKGLEHLGLAKAVLLVGHSYGELVTQLYAKHYPESVKGIVLIDPNTVAFVDAIGGPESLMTIPFDTTPPLSKVQRAGVRQIKAFAKKVEALRSAPISKESSRYGRHRRHAVVADTGTQHGVSGWARGDRGRSGESFAVVAEESAHNIPGERPDVVMSAVEEMIGRIRGKQHR